MATTFKRSDRIADRLWQELSKLLQKEVHDPRVSWVTISGVELSSDLGYAKIYFTTLVDEKSDEASAVLNKASGFLRHLLTKRLELRVIPQLKFIYDDTTIKARHMDKLIAEVVV
jgi:ribosome-binding factor A